MRWVNSFARKTARRFSKQLGGSDGQTADMIRAGLDVGLAAKPKISVVLGSYNRFAILPHTIESVRSQIAEEDREIIVVDGGSTDGGLEWLVAQNDIVTIVQHNRFQKDGRRMMRGSWGYFMNLAFRAARAEHVFMISDDCLVLPGSVDAAMARYDTLKAAGRKIGGVAFYFRNWPAERDYYVQRTVGGRLMVNHGFFSKAALQDVGYIDEDGYFFYKADGDLCLRIWQAGYEIVDAEGAFVEHYLDAAETVRQANNQLLNHDRRRYLERWTPVYGDAPLANAGKTTLPFNDSAGTAERIFGAVARSSGAPST